jgi:hypothetical protein
MSKQKRFWLIGAGALLLSLVVFLGTARYGSYGPAAQGVHWIARPPVASIMWGPKHRFMVQSGLNVALDHGLGAPGHFIEFPIWPDERVSIHLFSVNWFRQELAAWKSNHGLGCEASRQEYRRNRGR